MEQFGKRVVRDHMPEQHRAFYQQLPFILIGHADDNGWPWASMLFGEPGFMVSQDAKTLEIQSTPVKGDPLAESLKPNLKLGLLGIELTTRRRNRLAAKIKSVSENSIKLSIDQSFGNCPQYIQIRELEKVPAEMMPKSTVEMLSNIDHRARDLIENVDTFFVASYHDDGSDAPTNGADVSHRGGKPGFVRVDNETTLTIPDYAGNFHFNTFGNFIENPKAGLLFVDFEHGDLLTLTGHVELIWESEEIEFFEGAQRLWKFHIHQGRRINYGLPLRWKLKEYSANTLMTGTWGEAVQQQNLVNQLDSWLSYRISKIVSESPSIKSVYLSSDNGVLPKFKPGQFLTIKANIDKKEQIRTYTLSNAPADPEYRLSVKIEQTASSIPDGVFSNYIHNTLQVGDIISAKAPRGSFVFDSDKLRPAVLLAGGVGITPMISMARDALHTGVRTRSIRPMSIFVSTKNMAQRAFFDELKEISRLSGGYINTIWALTQTDEHATPGHDFHHSGRISASLLQSVLPLDDYDYYICGPSGFMQNMYDMLRKLGVVDKRIHAEEFGPASLVREIDVASTGFVQKPHAAAAIIEFTRSKVEQAWSPDDGSLLDFSENHGFTPEYGCRSGQCGACKVTLSEGSVCYQTEHSFPLEGNEVLLCCAVPAAEEGQDVVKISLDM
ncbi:pyridoxamine 5'-phosphate oxidase family protein [Shewanella sp. SG41-4]|uniref:pyridoxamine 5'-phosphate oxidase family protein n=1 Tax=Shewanella sp. SG41-4 TaxID=2760976 RepID=UPI00300D7E7A